MNRYDPEKKIALLVDEWGNWFDVEEGTNPGFLYQQNTMRDAVTAAVYLNIFNCHSDRVRMANIAQAVNVLQSILLTDGEKLIKTPTYHVFDLFKEHQGAELIYSHLENERIADGRIPMLSYSASVKDGKVIVTIANCSLEEDAEVTLAAADGQLSADTFRLLTNEVHAYNDAGNPEKVVICQGNVEMKDGRAVVKLPACSVAELIMEA